MSGLRTGNRLLRLLGLLQSRPYWRAEELADALEVTTRTIRRDLDRLRELGHQVTASTGPHGGYRLAAGGALPPLQLEDGEAVAVALALRAAAGGTVAGLAETAPAVLAKLERVLPERLADRVAALVESTVRLGGPDLDQADAAVLAALADGCRLAERMRFGYRNARGESSARHVEPYRLVHTHRRWYLLARDVDRADWRVFRADRVQQPSSTGHRFHRTDPPDVTSMVTESLTLAPYRVTARVLLDTTYERAAQLIPPTVGFVEAGPDGVIARIGGNDVEWIAGQLARLPCEWWALDPPELADAVRAVAARLLAAVGDGPTAR